MFCFAKGIFSRRYLFLVLLVTCVFVIILFLHAFSSPNSTILEVIGESKGPSKYTPRVVQKFPKEMLIGNFDECLKANFTVHEYIKFGIKEIHKNNGENKFMFETLLKFSEISHHFKIETILIDPFVLFCMLSIPLKKMLLKRKLKLENGKKIPYLLNLGVFNKDVAQFEKKATVAVLKKNGFEMEIIHRPRLKWMEYDNGDLFTSHIFLKHKGCLLNVVVFHERNKYVWHSSFTYAPHNLNFTNENVNFISHDSAFENFTAVSLGFKSKILKNIKIPSKPAEFLFQTEHSRFLECNMTIVEEFKKINVSEELPNKHYSYSISEFNDILEEAIQELKLQFDPLFLRFWIWSGTMLGWYRECDVIPYTGDIDFGAWSTDVDDLDKLLEIFQKNELLVIKQKMGLVDEGLEFNLNCLGIRVDIFFLEEESNGTWYAGHRPSRGYYFKYHHPNFSLCSADLLGHKVLVPCETESVIAMEYGPEWMLPVSSWNYESSIYNRGPNIYWNETLLDKIYSNF